MAEELKKKKRRNRKRCRTVKRTRWVDGKKKTVKVRKCKPRKRKPQPPGSTHPPAPRRHAARRRPRAAGPARPATAAAEDDHVADRGVRGHVRRAHRPSGCCGAPASARAPARPTRSRRMGLEAAVLSLTRPTGEAVLDGPGAARRRAPLAPVRHLVRRPPLLVRPHGPLAITAGRAARARLPRLVGDVQRRGRRDALMLTQTNIFRAHGLGSFRDMTRAITADPAMLSSSTGSTTARARSTRTTGAS